MKRIPMAVLIAAALIAQPALARGGHAGGHFGGGAHFSGGARFSGGHFGGGFAVRSRPFFGPRTRIFIGAPFIAAPFYYAPYYAPPVVYAPPPVYYQPTPGIIVPPTQPGASGYIEQQPGPSASTPDAGAWWYYCAEQQAYYPYVKQCPGGWQKVPPEPPPS